MQPKSLLAKVFLFVYVYLYFNVLDLFYTVFNILVVISRNTVNESNDMRAKNGYFMHPHTFHVTCLRSTLQIRFCAVAHDL